MNKEKKETETSVLKTLADIHIFLKKNENKPLSFTEAAAYLGFRPSYLYKLTHKKQIRFYKPSGKKLFFSKSDLDNWIFCTSKISSKRKADSNNGTLKIQNLDEEDDDDL